MPSEWKKCIYQANECFAHLCAHFDDMLDGMHIRHFDIHCANYSMMGYHEEVATRHGNCIHLALTPWIREEAQSGRLFKRSHWKPFRKPCSYTACYTGYRKLFTYDKYTFQLTIAKDKDWNNQGVREEWICFEAALYGKDNNDEQDEDGMIPKKRWKHR